MKLKSLIILVCLLVFTCFDPTVIFSAQTNLLESIPGDGDGLAVEELDSIMDVNQTTTTETNFISTPALKNVDASTEQGWLPWLTLLIIGIIVCLLILSVWYVKVLKQSNELVNEVFNEVAQEQGFQYVAQEKLLSESPKNIPIQEAKALSTPISQSESSLKAPVVESPPQMEVQDKRIPSDAQNKILKAVVWRKSGNLDSALEIISQLEESYPQSLDVHLQKGVILEKKSEWGEAMSAYDQAIQLSPENPIGYLRKARLLERMQKYSESRQLYKQALSSAA